MDEGENTFPMDSTDPSSRPWNFRPEGYLVVILFGHGRGATGRDGARGGRVRPSRRQALHRQADPGQPRGVHEAPECHEQGGGRNGPTTSRAGSCTSGTPERIDARCGCASPMKPMCQRLFVARGPRLSTHALLRRREPDGLPPLLTGWGRSRRICSSSSCDRNRRAISSRRGDLNP